MGGLQAFRVLPAPASQGPHPSPALRGCGSGSVLHADAGCARVARPTSARRRTAAEQVLARLAAYPRRVDQKLVRLREGISLGSDIPPAEQDSLGWTPLRAADCMTEHSGIERGTVESEIDRYLSDPGQALGYMIGQLKIIELRDRARARLGDRFDIRRFHRVLLDQGAVPLPLLERLVDDWIAVEAAKS